MLRVPCFDHPSLDITVKVGQVVGELVEHDFKGAGKCLVDIFRLEILIEALIIFYEILSAPFEGQLGRHGAGNRGRQRSDYAAVPVETCPHEVKEDCLEFCRLWRHYRN